VRVRHLYFKQQSALGKKGGRIVLRRRCRGQRKLRCFIDFVRRLMYVPGRVVGFEPRRRGAVARIVYFNGLVSFVLRDRGIRRGNCVVSGLLGFGITGNMVPLYSVIRGVFVYSLEVRPGEGAVFCRSPGATCRLMKEDDNIEKDSRFIGYLPIKLPSGEERWLDERCRANLGAAGFVPDKPKYLRVGGRFIKQKGPLASSTRRRGRRPRVRGVAMNAVDHPMGGGVGRSSGGQPSVSKWGWLTKGGIKTRKRFFECVIMSKQRHRYLERKRKGLL